MLLARIFRIVISVVGGIVLMVVGLKVAFDILGVASPFIAQASAYLTDPFYMRLNLPFVTLPGGHTLRLVDVVALLGYALFFSLLLAILNYPARKHRRSAR